MCHDNEEWREKMVMKAYWKIKAMMAGVEAEGPAHNAT